MIEPKENLNDPTRLLTIARKNKEVIKICVCSSKSYKNKGRIDRTQRC